MLSARIKFAIVVKSIQHLMHRDATPAANSDCDKFRFYWGNRQPATKNDGKKDTELWCCDATESIRINAHERKVTLFLYLIHLHNKQTHQNASKIENNDELSYSFKYSNDWRLHADEREKAVVAMTLNRSNRNHNPIFNFRDYIRMCVC